MVIRPLSDQDRIAIAEIAVYAFYLFGGVHLCLKHGISRTAGFRFLVLLALARLIGSSLLLATLRDATHVSLYVGWAITNGVGLGPLILMLLGLLSRAFESINASSSPAPILPPRVGRLVQLAMLVAMVLVIVGGTQSDYSKDGVSIVVNYNNISKAGMGLMIAVVVAMLAQLGLAVVHRNKMEAGERRILPAVAAAVPFMVVRLAYGCVVIFGRKNPSVWVYLVTSVIMEFLVCFIVELVGFTLRKIPKYQEARAQDEEAEAEMSKHGFH